MAGSRLATSPSWCAAALGLLLRSVQHTCTALRPSRFSLFVFPQRPGRLLLCCMALALVPIERLNAAQTPAGALRIIDRKKNFFKLAHGEYVAAEKIENVCKKVDVVDQVWIYGESDKNALVAVVVPSRSALESVASDLGKSGTFEVLTRAFQALRVLMNPGRDLETFLSFLPPRRSWNVRPWHSPALVVA